MIKKKKNQRPEEERICDVKTKIHCKDQKENPWKQRTKA